jgi:hypothetical protein
MAISRPEGPDQLQVGHTQALSSRAGISGECFVLWMGMERIFSVDFDSGTKKDNWRVA